MQHADFLFIVAEIAIAFAGFAGLVTVISKREDRSAAQSHLDVERLKVVLVLSLLTAAFALLPSLISRMEADPETAWRVAAGLFLVVSVGFLGRSVPVVLRAYGPANHGVPRTVWLSLGVIGAKWIALALCAIGILPVSTYLAALFATLYLAGVTFVRIFVSLASDTPTA
jgi:hypothetical protein